MRKVVVNSTPIISLSIIGELELLKMLYDEVYIPNAVFREISVDGESRAGSKFLENYNFIKVVSITNDETRRFFSASLHDGEVETMILAKEIEADLAIIDDYTARKYANYFGITITGTIGVLIKAKERGYIKKVKPLIDMLINNGIYIGQRLYKDILRITGE